MKHRILIFKLLSVACAVFGAVLSARAIAPGQTHLKYICNGVEFCSTIGNYCNAGPNICKVVITFNGTQTNVTGWNHGCTVRLQMSGTSPILTTSSKVFPGCLIVN